ncbi:hypothetical protein [Nocardia stercoris]|uniref:ESX-1 secretion-associated protein n=1 Tax=Nocardia stercoris TaxID=2483361 RepID=A0A3M2L050_9NOCA|nr:hypothetical protein [Nocardia stercoris]RMI30941.1 hypothetical protein EBN03_20155 [Nocardia stercoris]
MGDDNGSFSIDLHALQTFGDDLRSEATAIIGLKPDLAAAAGALPGTDWNATCTAADTSVDQAMKRMGARYTAIADSIEQAGKALQLTVDQFATDLKQIGEQV